jgi:hypothetical protein
VHQLSPLPAFLALPADVLTLVANAHQIPKPPLRLGPRLSFRPPSPDQLVHRAFDVETKFLRDIRCHRIIQP